MLCMHKGSGQRAPEEAGRVKASRRLMRKGWRSRRRMHTSRSTRLAWSGLLSTSGMRLSATCAHWRAPAHAAALFLPPLLHHLPLAYKASRVEGASSDS